MILSHDIRGLTDEPRAARHDLGRETQPVLERECMDRDASKVLIYRLGSIGDTVVALPALRLVARAFPNAERRVLTAFPDHMKAAPVDAIIGPMRLVHGYFRYPVGTRNPAELLRLVLEIRAWGPKVLVYLAEPRGRLKAVRDAALFKLAGVQSLIGVPWTKIRQRPLRDDERGLWESEAKRLARCITVLGDAAVESPASWDLMLTSSERAKASAVLKGWGDAENFVAASIGAKISVKDWGLDNWRRLFSLWSLRHPDIGLVLVGAAEDVGLSAEAASAWQGPTLNLCGRLTPRESAAVLERALFFVGHDGGPMHLAAAVGTPCVAVFSGRSLPGLWFPFGQGNFVLYNRTQCSGCGLESCERYEKACLRGIAVEEVSAAMDEMLCTRVSV